MNRRKKEIIHINQLQKNVWEHSHAVLCARYVQLQNVYIYIYYTDVVLVDIR